jgi:hypothetical protein
VGEEDAVPVRRLTVHKEKNMAKIISIGFTAAAILSVTAAVAAAQPAVPLKQVPSGFTVTTNKTDDTTVQMEATKPNSTKPKISVDTEIHLGFSWRLFPGAAQIIDIMAASPEEEVSDQGGIKDEPAGKTRLKGGVLTFRKSTVLQIGTNAAPWVTYKGVWIAESEGGMLAISVTNYAGPKEDIQPWIEALIPAAKTNRR